MSTVGRNEKKIREYIQNRIQEDKASEQISMKEYIDSFGEYQEENKSAKE